MPFRIWPDVGDPAAVEHLLLLQPPERIVETFPNLKMVFSVGAGVDQFDLSQLPAELPAVRMPEPGIAESMAEFLCMATLMLHHDVAAYIDQQPRRCRGTDRATAPSWQTPATSLRKGQVYSGAARTSRAALQSRAVPSRAEPIEAAKTAILAAAKSAGAPKACPAMKSDMVKPIPASALAPAS